jgi:hypothetical protein
VGAEGNWADEEIEGLCAELDLVHGVDPFVRKPVFDGIRCFRLHGRESYRYT